MTAATLPLAVVGRFSVLHTPGSPLVTVAGDYHGEQLDRDGWKARVAFYRRMRDRQEGRFAHFYGASLAAAEIALAALEREGG